MYGAYLM